MNTVLFRANCEWTELQEGTPKPLARETRFSETGPDSMRQDNG
jgi:hypothetical protein